MRRFSLYRRGKVWYAAFWNPATHRYVGGKSTGKTDKNQALVEVARWERGIVSRGKVRSLGALQDVDTLVHSIRVLPLESNDAERIIAALKARRLIEYAVIRDGPAAEPLVDFLLRFWSYEESPYVKDKLAHHHRIGRRHCYDMALCARVYWKPFFGDKRLAEIGKTDLNDFSVHLIKERGLAGKTANNVLAAGTTAFNWAAANAIIPVSPALGLMRFGGKAERRGVLTEEEVRRLFAEPWPDERSWLGNMLAMSTGMRQGECLAVQVRDIDTDRLQVRHSWGEIDRLKTTKTGEERVVPLLPGLRAALLELARKNPHGIGPTSFVFWSIDCPDRPMDAHGLADPLRAALLRLTLTDEDRKKTEKVKEAREYWRRRRVCFHSWRHYYAARMADRLEARKVMVSTGHANGAVFQAYADHGSEEVFQEVRTAATETFGHLLQFPETKGT